MGKTKTNNRSQLTREQGEQLFRAVWEALDPNGAPIRLAEIVDVAKTHDAELGALWDFYLLVSDELQRMKRAGCAVLVKGRGGGWIRGHAPPAVASALERDVLDQPCNNTSPAVVHRPLARLAPRARLRQRRRQAAQHGRGARDRGERRRPPMKDPIPSYVPKLKLARTHHAATTYHLVPEGRDFGWALCTVNDSTGELLITSDWGNWAHRWSADPAHLGAPTLTHFLGERAGCHCHYLADKLTRREDRERFDARETVKHMRRVLCEQRLEQGRAVIDYYRDEDPEDRIDVGGDWSEHALGVEAREVWYYGSKERWPLTKRTARDIFRRLDRLGGCLSAEEFVEDFLRIGGHEWITDEPHYELRTRPTTEYMVLLHGILPALVEACAAEVKRREAAAGVEVTVR